MAAPANTCAVPQSEMGISGGNFIIAETGTLCLVTNRGNGRMVTTLPRYMWR